MVVDDELSLRILYEKELRKEGYQVFLAASGSEALDKFEQVNPDLVVLDIHMPGMDGIETMNRMLDINAKLPVLLNTGYSDYKDDFRSWSAESYIIKSGDLSELKNTIKKVLEKKTSDS